ncbi:hypothetical protein DUT91_01385 [Phyllobacterium salinisoli]|uniref:Antifreeze protein n=1 Tax=Phyllobacterium salinisoli TaxID=1899321 RepID=A0A368KAF8_9HYPH|nr:hypothetical protein [Phyllobacterium salinisoli]RCS25483.1 hypothetical protein DUT91_01385 [Phyllobacterium salinisoli]
MNKNFILAIAAVSLAALAGCSDSQQASEAQTTQPTAAAAAGSSTEAEAMKTAEELVKSMTPAQKTAAIGDARTAAEAAARAAGQSDALITQAGEAAADAAQKALGVQ